jgi:hypothetical protein
MIRGPRRSPRPPQSIWKPAWPNVESGDYMGEHWLATFAVYAMTQGA